MDRPLAPYMPWFMDPRTKGPPKRQTADATAAPRRMGGRVLGEVEEYFAETLTIGDTFLFAGEVLRFEGIAEDDVLVTRAAPSAEPKIPSYAGGKFPLSTHLAGARPGDPGGPGLVGRPARPGGELARPAERGLAAAAGRRPPGRDLRAGRRNSTSSPIPSRAGSRTRRSACC